MAAPSYDYRIDWNADGDWSDTGENVSSRILATPAVSISYGRDNARALSPTAVGQASFALDNRSRDYSPENGSSPLAGNLLPARPVKLEATHSSTTYGLFRGHIDDYQVDPQHKTVAISCLDALARVRGSDVATPVYQGVRTGDAINRLLDAIGWDPDARDIDPGATLISHWWGEGDAGDLLEALVRSEGPTAYISVDANGKFMFRDRHHRLLRSASLTSQATIAAGSGSGIRFSYPMEYDQGWADIINDAVFDVQQRRAQPVDQVWSSEDTYTIDSGDTIHITAHANDPFMNAVTPEEDVDYVTTTGAVTITLTRDTGQSTTIIVTASAGGPAVVRGMALRAESFEVVRTVRVHVEDTASITKYGRRSWPDDAPWAGVYDALALGQLIVGQRAERLASVRVRLIGYSDTNRTQQLSRDLSDRVTITDSEVGLNDEFFLEQIEHEISGAGDRLHVTTFGCEKAVTIPGNLFRFNTAGAGFNDGVFAAEGVDDPDTIFIFDNNTAGHRFDSGLFAT